MYCRKCGKEIPGDSRFCQYCGVPVQIMEAQAIEQTVCLTPQQAKAGIVKKVLIDGAANEVEIHFPPNLCDGQMLRLRKVKFISDSGKTVKKEILLKIEVREPKS